MIEGTRCQKNWATELNAYLSTTQIDVSIQRDRKYGGKKMKAVHYKSKVKEINLTPRVSRRLLGQAPEEIVSRYTLNSGTNLGYKLRRCLAD